jgi:Helix-turn-helix domain
VEVAQRRQPPAFLVRVRAEASLTAYETALTWLQRYPVHEVERRLLEKVTEKRAELTVADQPPEADDRPDEPPGRASASLTQMIPEAEAARYVALSPAYLRQARQKNRGPAFLRIGRAIRYRTADLDVWLAQQRVEPRRP